MINKPRVAIIGAGIFGVSCAIELSKFANVSIFDKNNDIFSEASFVNQYRHHWGYHYPRSPETVRDIQEAILPFEKIYEDAIIRNFPTYYGIAKEGSKITANDYISFCEAHNLPFELEFPEKKFIDRAKIEICLKTLEPIYDFKKLKALAKNQIESAENITMNLDCQVTKVNIDPDNIKNIIFQKNKLIYQEKFDFVINATYANINQFADWLNFPKKEIRLDLVEALIMELPIPMISLAIMDGPFTNLVPTGEKNLFTLVHIKESILHRFIPHNGLIPKNIEISSRSKIIIEKSKEWFPILDQGRLIETRYVYRSVNAHREHDDARPSDIESHGFGCWSILGGKILNSVKVAIDISKEIKNNLS